MSQKPSQHLDIQMENYKQEYTQVDKIQFEERMIEIENRIALLENIVFALPQTIRKVYGGKNEDIDDH